MGDGRHREGLKNGLIAVVENDLDVNTTLAYGDLDNRSNESGVWGCRYQQLDQLRLVNGDHARVSSGVARDEHRESLQSVMDNVSRVWDE